MNDETKETQETGKQFGGLDFTNPPEVDANDTDNAISMDKLAGYLFKLTNVFGMAKNADSFKRGNVLGYLRETLKNKSLKPYEDYINSKITKKVKTFDVGKFEDLQAKAKSTDENESSGAIAELISLKLDVKEYSPFETSVTHTLQGLEKSKALKRNEDNTTMWEVVDADKLRGLINKYDDPLASGNEEETKKDAAETENE